MRAIRITEWGGPEVLELADDAPVPEPGDGQLLVRVTRAGINFADTHARENSYLARYELPLVPGAEVAGVVEQDAHGFTAGQRVVALVGTGGYAEYVAAPAATTFAVPEGVSDATALALLLQGLTAWHLYRTSAHIQPGESVVVHAAAGGVGSLAVQLGKPLGAGRVIATASTEAKRELALELGADAAVDVDARGPRRRAGRGQPRRARRRRARDGRRPRVRREPRRARPVRAARHLRHRVARAEHGRLGRADAQEPRRRRLLADALPAAPRGAGRRAAAGAVRARRGRRAARRRGRDLPAVGGAARARGPPGAPHLRQADARSRIRPPVEISYFAATFW